jgi:hypothetical protein
MCGGISQDQELFWRVEEGGADQCGVAVPRCCYRVHLEGILAHSSNLNFERVLSADKEQLISFFVLLNGASWTRGSVGRPFKRIGNASIEDGEDDHRRTMRRLIENATTEEPYRDDPEAAGAVASNGNDGPRVLPSTLGETPNEWADEAQGNRDARANA